MDLYKGIVIVISYTVTYCHPPGHMKPLGTHMTPADSDIDAIDDFPPPWVFYNDYVNPSKPLLIKNILQKGGLPAYLKWTDEYLSERYGDERVHFEVGKKENRKVGGVKSFTLSKFLNYYKDMDIYMVHDLPQKMEDDFTVPISLHCGGFQKRVNSVVMWFSGGSTKSVLHNDDADNINCLLDGKKDLILIDKKYKHLVEADGWNHDGTYSDIDVDAVDMNKFPKLRDVPFFQVSLSKGDCFFIPYHWYHQVNSHTGRNFAVNVWFQNLRWFNETDCEGFDETSASPMPLSLFPRTSDVEEYRYFIMKLFDDEKFVTKLRFKEEFSDLERLDKIFDSIDKDNNGILTFKEMYVFDNRDLLVELVTHLGMSNEEDEETEEDNRDRKSNEQIRTNKYKHEDL